jgi:hypothetical protein
VVENVAKILEQIRREIDLFAHAASLSLCRKRRARGLEGPRESTVPIRRVAIAPKKQGVSGDRFRLVEAS